MNKRQAAEAMRRVTRMWGPVATATPRDPQGDVSVIKYAQDIMGIVERCKFLEQIIDNHQRRDQQMAKSIQAEMVVPTLTATATDTTPAHFAGSTSCGPDCCEAH